MFLLTKSISPSLNLYLQLRDLYTSLSYKTRDASPSCRLIGCTDFPANIFFVLLAMPHCSSRRGRNCRCNGCPFSLFTRQRDISHAILLASARLPPSDSQWRTICRSLKDFVPDLLFVCSRGLGYIPFPGLTLRVICDKRNIICCDITFAVASLSKRLHIRSYNIIIEST